MGISYKRATMRFQREKIKKCLANKLPTDKISRRQYLNEMANSKICLSPFGLGEITLKDFECFLAGSLLMKPDMSHMNTWPNFYQKDKTYIAHDWDITNLEEKIEWVLDNNEKRVEIAQNAQDLYVAHTTRKDAGRLFAEHFKNIIESC